MSRRLSNGIFMCTDQAGATSPTTACTRLGALQNRPQLRGSPSAGVGFWDRPAKCPQGSRDLSPECVTRSGTEQAPGLA